MAQPRCAVPPVPYDPRRSGTSSTSMVECLSSAGAGRPFYRPLHLTSLRLWPPPKCAHCPIVLSSSLCSNQWSRGRADRNGALVLQQGTSNHLVSSCLVSLRSAGEGRLPSGCLVLSGGSIARFPPNPRNNGDGATSA
jgi:hypothetical protein